VNARTWRDTGRRNLALDVQILAGLLVFGVAGFAIGRVSAPAEVVEIRTTITLAVPPACQAMSDAGGIVMEKWDQVDIHDGLATDWATKNSAATYGRQQDQAAGFALEAAKEVDLRDAAEAERDTARAAWNDARVACNAHRAPVRSTSRIAR
jgi:hypothetical protein